MGDILHPGEHLRPLFFQAAPHRATQGDVAILDGDGDGVVVKQHINFQTPFDLLANLPIGTFSLDDDVNLAVDVTHALHATNHMFCQPFFLPGTDFARQHNDTLIRLHVEFVGIGGRILKERRGHALLKLIIKDPSRMNLDLVHNASHTLDGFGQARRTFPGEDIVDGSLQGDDTFRAGHVDEMRGHTLVEQQVELHRLGRVPIAGFLRGGT